MRSEVECYKKNNSLILKSGRLQIAFLDNGQSHIIDSETDIVFADGQYLFEGLKQLVDMDDPKIKKLNDGSIIVSRKMTSEKLLITQTYEIDTGFENAIKETISLENTGSETIDTACFACGFTISIDDKKDRRICEIPNRYHTETGDFLDYSLDEFAKKKHWYSTMRNDMYNRQTSVTAGAEGWAFYGIGNALSVTKYNPVSIEWSLAKAVFHKDKEFIRFGGAGTWKLGDPEYALELGAGQKAVFGTTTYKILDGDWGNAYKDYRDSMQQKGHDIPDGYNPPVHWNELYNNPYWYSVPLADDFWHADNSAILKKMYGRQLMLEEAKNACKYSCECLYLDPGWDTSFSSNIWDEKRMGNMKEFADEIKEEYGLTLALHTPLAPWTSNESYPKEQRRMNKTGERDSDLCVASNGYIETKTERLKKLCEAGTYFLMYDGSWYEGPCFDKNHGHSVPSTRQEHVDAILKIQQKVHEVYPNVVIEQHDPITGPGTPRYTPLYFMHGKKNAFDEIWGFEFMNEPLEDLISGRAFSLYYYNLAYNIPIYLHIDLRKDNKRCLMLWWFVSTCRHLGFGGLHEDEKVRDSQKRVMRMYRENKRFFTCGSFYGVDELTHIHTLSEDNASIVNCFNVENEQKESKLNIKAGEVGLDMNKTITFDVIIPPEGHRAVKVDWSALTASYID